jgi:prolyl oligopeptidase
MHAFGWTRERAIDYFLANAAKTRLDVENEIDRYITDPGQALAYKIGQLELLALRDRARERLGARFDLRDYHAVVLGAGSVPLDVLDRRVEDWLAQA